MLPVIQQRLSSKSTQCAQYTRAEQLFLNEGHRNFRCYLDPLKNTEFVKDTRQSLLLSITEKKQPKARPWPEGLMQSDATRQDIDVIVPRIIRGQLLQIPALQAAHIRSKGAEGWPAWFRVGVFIEVMALDPSPLIDAPMLELRDFSLGREADATLQQALRLRMSAQPRMRTLIEARLKQKPTWFAAPKLKKGEQRFDERGYKPETLKAMRHYGVVALTKEQRNIELRKLLRPDKP
jgi:hypothetical protein